MSATLQDKLSQVRERLAQARAHRTELQRQQDDCRGKMADVDFSGSAQDVINSSAFKEAEHIVGELGKCKDEIIAFEEIETAILRQMGNRGNGAGEAAHSFGSGMQERSVGWNGRELLAQSEGYRQILETRNHVSTSRFGTYEIGKVCTREELIPFLSPRQAAVSTGYVPTAAAGVLSTTSGAVPYDFRGTVPPMLMSLSLLDLIPTGTTDSNQISYVRVIGIPGYAAETSEGYVKPAEGLTLENATANVATIAGYAKINRQALDDTPGLATLINTLIPWDVRRRLLNQILFGAGSGADLTGIVNTTGIGSPASVSGDNGADAILRAATTVVLSDGDPFFVAINPSTWQKMLLTKSSSTGQYLIGDMADYSPGPEYTNVNAPFSSQSIWGLRVIQHRLIPTTGSGPLVGDPMGATVMVREGVNIKISDSDQDDFVRNRVTILGETRVALPVWRPQAFALVNLGGGLGS